MVLKESVRGGERYHGHDLPHITLSFRRDCRAHVSQIVETKII